MNHDYAYSVDSSAREHLLPNLRLVASQPWVGLTAYVGDEPHLVIGREGDDTYIMENQCGQLKKVDFIFPWEEPKVEDNKLVAASRIPESPFRTAGILSYDPETGEWNVRVGTSNMRFPLEERVAALERDGWSKYSDAASPAGGLDLGGTHSLPHGPVHDHPGDGLREPTIEVRAACPHCGSDQHLEEMDHDEHPHGNTEKHFACHNCGKWSFEHELKVSDHDKDHQDANPDDVDYEDHDDDASRHQDPQGEKRHKHSSASFSFQGEIVLKVRGIRDGEAIKPEQQSSQEMLEHVQNMALPHEQEAEYVRQRYHDYGLGKKPFSYDNPFINRGGSAKEAAPEYVLPKLGPPSYPEEFHGGTYILVAKWLQPEHTIMFEKANGGEGIDPRFKGIITMLGGPGSHAVVVAQGNGLPCIKASSEDIDRIQPGDHIVMDGTTGVVHVNGGDPSFVAQDPSSIKSNHELYRFAYANGHGHVEEMKPGAMVGDLGGHMGMMQMLMNSGHGVMQTNEDYSQMTHNVALGYFMSDGEIIQDVNEIPDEEQFIQWAHAQEEQLGLPQGPVKRLDISAYAPAAPAASPVPSGEIPGAYASMRNFAAAEDDSGGIKLDKANKCPHCGSHTVELLSRDDATGQAEWLCLNCDNTFKAHYRRTAGAKHPNGTRVEVTHPSKKGIKGSIADHAGTDENFGDELYDLLLDNGDELKKVPDVHFKKIKSAKVSSIVVVGLHDEVAEYASMLAHATDQDPDEIAADLADKGMIHNDQEWTEVIEVINHERGNNPQTLSSMQRELVNKTVAQQEAKIKTYETLKSFGLPIPPDLQAEAAEVPPRWFKDELDRRNPQWQLEGL